MLAQILTLACGLCCFGLSSVTANVLQAEVGGKHDQFTLILCARIIQFINCEQPCSPLSIRILFMAPVNEVFHNISAGLSRFKVFCIRQSTFYSNYVILLYHYRLLMIYYNVLMMMFSVLLQQCREELFMFPKCLFSLPQTLLTFVSC